MATGTCVECGTTFSYRRRGSPQITCSQDCRTLHRSKGTETRWLRLALRQTPIGPMGYAERILCRFVGSEPDYEPHRAFTETPAAAVLYIGTDGLTHALCSGHDTDGARALAAERGLRRVELAS